MSEDTPKGPVQAPQVKPTNGMATAGFVLAFFTLIPFLGFVIFILSVTFCSIGWRRANVEGRQGKGLAIAGIIINIFTFILTIIIVIAIIAATGESSTDDQQVTSPTAQSSSASEATPEIAVEQSRKVKVGNLELEVVGIEPYDASVHNMFNDANTRVELKVRKIRGDEYDFTLSTVTLIDTNGVGYDTYFACADCPGSLGDTKLYSSTEVTRYAYFEIPPGTTVTHLRYEPFSITTDPVTITIPE